MNHHAVVIPEASTNRDARPIATVRGSLELPVKRGRSLVPSSASASPVVAWRADVQAAHFPRAPRPAEVRTQLPANERDSYVDRVTSWGGIIEHPDMTGWR